MKYTEDIIANVMNTINDVLESKGLIACGYEVDEPFLKIVIDEDVVNENKITYQPVDNCEECYFYKYGAEANYEEIKAKDESDGIPYYLPPYRGNPFKEGSMSGLWGEHEYYCPKCNLEITQAFYDSEHIKVGDCSKCPKCREMEKC